MRSPALLGLVLAALASPAAALTFRAVEPFSEKGAFDLIIVPEPWNGGLIIYAHGYTADQRTIVAYPADITPSNIASKLTGGDQVLQVPLNFGYAAATTTYRSVGWALADAVKDIENIRRHFIRRYAKPMHTYIWGHSEGGMVTEAVAELFPHTYDGALPFCAPGAGARRNFDGGFDLRAIYEYVCGGCPTHTFSATSARLARRAASTTWTARPVRPAARPRPHRHPRMGSRVNVPTFCSAARIT